MADHDAGVERLAAVVHGMVGMDEPGAVMWALRLGIELRVLRAVPDRSVLAWAPDRVTVVVVDDVVVEAFPG